MVLLFICGYVGKATGNSEDTELTKVRKMNFELLLEFNSRSSEPKGVLKTWMPSFSKRLRELRNIDA